jgi:hypothetical protein
VIHRFQQTVLDFPAPRPDLITRLPHHHRYRLQQTHVGGRRKALFFLLLSLAAPGRARPQGTRLRIIARRFACTDAHVPRPHGVAHPCVPAFALKTDCSARVCGTDHAGRTYA